MTYSVTGIKPISSGIRTTELTCFDTEDDAKATAENWLKSGYAEVTVWQQIAIPKLETTVSWEGRG